ncbi:VOC family protein [Nocardiopsis sp. HNM0947]|uniref:VOC family protein n=1 Tax=Nocardiopsis coralli TaxID=2772213 RepID=A0ABR9PBM7_9ACTN|nr:VOC family protein [Nocardiopsis coralli]MBE3001242.1 VOC family protein [Nocardiopsis coralli]
MRMNYVLDTCDLQGAARFWSAALGMRAAERDHSPYLTLSDPEGRFPPLLLQQVPEPKQGKNRMHLDLHVEDARAETERLTGLGARVLRPFFEEEGYLLVVLADPEGNEFCVIEPLDDR